MKKRKPDRVTLERVYRKLLAIGADMVTQLAIVRLDLQALREHIPKLTDHCARLLREKEALQRQLDRAQHERQNLRYLRSFVCRIRPAILSSLPRESAQPGESIYDHHRFNQRCPNCE